MKKIIVRITENGYDINGNHLFRVYAYSPGCDKYKTYYRLEREEMRSHCPGRFNKDGSITTQAYKQEIMDRFNKDYDAIFIFE